MNVWMCECSQGPCVHVHVHVQVHVLVHVRAGRLRALSALLHSALLHTALLQEASRACLQVSRGLGCTEALLPLMRGWRVGTGACLRLAVRCERVERWCEMCLCCCGVCVVLEGEARMAEVSMAGVAGRDGTARLIGDGRQFQLEVVKQQTKNHWSCNCTRHLELQLLQPVAALVELCGQRGTAAGVPERAAEADRRRREAVLRARRR